MRKVDGVEGLLRGSRTADVRVQVTVYVLVVA